MVLVLDMTLSSDYRSLQGNVSRDFKMFSSVTMIKTAVWLGLANTVSPASFPLFVSSSSSCNLLQISGLIHSKVHFHRWVLFRVTLASLFSRGQ